MDLGNPVETIMYYFLIGGMTCLDRQNEFPIISALVCMVSHWIGLMVNNDISLSIVMIHYMHGLSTLRDY